ncbi:MAG: PAS domain S-box-containing protein [Paraglaciecola sp.]|jgi:PAS domain S-box-containing protein
MSKPHADKHSNQKNHENIAMFDGLPAPLLNKKMSDFANMVNVIAEGIFIVNPQGVIEIINPLAATFFGAPQESLVGQKWFYFLHHGYRKDYQDLCLNLSLQNATKLPVNHGPKEVLFNRVDGTWLEADLSISCLPQSLTGSTPLMIGVLHDLAKHKAEYSELRKLARADLLTGLANPYNLVQTLNKTK